tara:strand:+ start:3187 stop:3468 length:282 start_codon:yes stop_codon:yes gene_type:complete
MSLNAENASSTRWRGFEDDLLKTLTASLATSTFRPDWPRITKKYNASPVCTKRTTKSVRNRYIRLTNMKPKVPKAEKVKKKKKKKKKQKVVSE